MKSRKRKIVTFTAMTASFAVCLWITKNTQAGPQTVRMNGFVLGIMFLMIFAAYFGGIRKADRITAELQRAAAGLKEMSGAQYPRIKLRLLQFRNPYLKGQYDEFLKFQSKVPDADVEDFINVEEISVSTHRGIWETFPDFLTSIGILGTFAGLIIGLQGFDLSDLGRFSESVTPLLDGIKVAFLTSVYGISLSLSYSYGLLSAYGDMEEAAGIFLGKFHLLWGKEPGNDAQVLAEQKQQTEMLRELTETFQEQLAASFAEVITPTIMKLNDQFEVYSDGQQEMLKDAASRFADEFKNAFVGGFAQFEKNLEKTNDMQTQYMTFLDHTMKNLAQAVDGQQASIDNYILKSAAGQEANIKETAGLVRKMTTAVNSFSKAGGAYYDAVVSSADRIADKDQIFAREIQSFMSEAAKLTDTLKENSEKARGNDPEMQKTLKSLQDTFEEGMERICVSLDSLKKDQKLSGEKHTDMQNRDQSEILNRILFQMQELTELERRRQKEKPRVSLLRRMAVSGR